ncbi:MAG: hypothetical protein Q9M28_08345 [Mariprofundaceae bacterium]|nr:hypothetical protein [Mariprofundaceae bacterium]
MFFQEPSWLQFQHELQDNLHDNNLTHLFHVNQLPKESQCRDILDNIDSEHYRGIFNTLFEQVRTDKQLEAFRSPLTATGLFYVPMDGTQYHSSKKVSCPSCLTKKHGKGDVTYQHQVLQGAIMHPDCRQVIPLMPEPILNSDGEKKQDCEHNAAKRFLTQLRQDHPRLPLLIGGDGLFSDGPIIQHARALNMHYLFTCKPGDHSYLMEWLNAYDKWPWQQHTDEKGKTHRYRWRNQVPLSAQKDAPQVNYLEYEMLKDNTIVYRGSWVTDIEITLSNCWRLIQTGRCRWKIENECFNTLKNQGYHLTHNFGHGKQHLSHNMYLSTLLAFFLHQLLELCDEAYQQCRTVFCSKKSLWERIRQLLSLFIIDDWYWLFDWCLDPKHTRFTLVDIATV